MGVMFSSEAEGQKLDRDNLTYHLSLTTKFSLLGLILNYVTFTSWLVGVICPPIGRIMDGII